MSENNDSGNRWEKPAEEAGAETEAPAASAPAPDLEPGVEPDIEPAAAYAPVTTERASRLPSWVTTRGLAATGAAAAIFLGGGGIGYAVGASGHDDDRGFPGRFDRSSFAPGQGPGGQLPDGGQGPNFQQGPPDQFQGQSQGQSSDGTSSGADSDTSAS